MMTRIIKSHNELNGIKFSVAEFALIALVIGPFGVYYLLNAQLVYGLIAAGIVFNCLTVVAFGVSAWRSNQAGSGLKSLMSREARDRLKREHPDMMRETIILTLSIILPFVLLAIVLYEQLTARRAR